MADDILKTMPPEWAKQVRLLRDRGIDINTATKLVQHRMKKDKQPKSSSDKPPIRKDINGKPYPEWIQDELNDPGLSLETIGITSEEEDFEQGELQKEVDTQEYNNLQALELMDDLDADTNLTPKERIMAVDEYYKANGEDASTFDIQDKSLGLDKKLLLRYMMDQNEQLKHDESMNPTNFTQEAEQPSPGQSLMPDEQINELNN